jgi:sorting nexin-8
MIRDDGALTAFLSEPSFEDWRRRTPISIEEESASKRVDRTEEMSIPSDLEDKLTHMRSKVNGMIDHWQKVCIFAERMIKRRESAAVKHSLPTIVCAHSSCEQGDTARLTNTLRALIEMNATCWRGEQCELCNGVNKGIGSTATHFQRHTDLLEQRVSGRFQFNDSHH